MAVMHTCSLKSTWRLRFQLESLNSLLCLECLNGASMDPCGDNELGNRLKGQGYHLWVVTLALEPVTQRNHLLEGRADGPRPLKFEFMAPKI